MFIKIIKKITSGSPCSPDLNPIEWVWADLKNFVRKRLCESLEDVKKAVFDFQKQITKEYCVAHIQKLKEVIKVVIKNHGGHSDY